MLIVSNRPKIYMQQKMIKYTFRIYRLLKI